MTDFENDAIMGDVSRTLERLQRGLGRPLTMKEATRVADGLVRQVAGGQAPDAETAYWEAHDEDPYDMSKHTGRVAFATQRLLDGEEISRLQAQEGEESPAEWGDTQAEREAFAADAARRVNAEND